MVKFKKRFGKFVKWVGSNLLWMILCGIVVAAATGFTGTRIYKALMQSEQIPVYYTILLISCMVICVLLLIVLFMACIFVKNSNAGSDCSNCAKVLNVTNPELDEVEVESELHLEDRCHLKLTKRIQFKVIAERLSATCNTMIWTGSKYCGTVFEDGVPAKYNLVDSDRKQPPYKVWINFGESLRKGDSGYYSTVTKVEDGSICDGVVEGAMMQPYLRKMIKSNTQKLTLRVTVPDKLVKNVRKRIYGDSCAEIALTEYEIVKAKKIGNLYCYEWEIENPEILRMYSIEWEFSE